MIESDRARGLSEEGVLKLMPKEWGAGSHGETVGKSFPSRSNSKRQGS